MVLYKKLLDELTAQAKASPRFRCNLELRNSADDNSKRKLNVIELGTVLPVHRHRNMINLPIGQWHTIKSLESGTVLLEAQDGKWEAIKEEEVMRV